jgi:hypothetical protein
MVSSRAVQLDVGILASLMRRSLRLRRIADQGYGQGVTGAMYLPGARS